VTILLDISKVLTGEEVEKVSSMSETSEE